MGYKLNPTTGQYEIDPGGGGMDLMQSKTGYQGPQANLYFGSDGQYHQGQQPSAGAGYVYGQDGMQYHYGQGAVDSTGKALSQDSNYYNPAAQTQPGPTGATGTGGPDTTGWQYKGGYDPATMVQSEKNYFTDWAKGLAAEDPAKAKMDYANGTRDFGISDGLFAQLNGGSNPWAAPAATTTPTTQQAGNQYLNNSFTGANTPQLQQYQKNPYLDDMAAGLTRGAVDTWTRSIDPSIRSGAMAAGGFGGSRQGVVESNALNDWSKNLSDSLSNLYGNDYQQSQNRNLQKYQADQGYNLGLGGLALGNKNSDQGYDLGLRGNDLGYAGLDAQINQNNFGNNLAGANFGLNALQIQQLLNTNATGVASGAQNQPLSYWQQLLSGANAAGGNGGTTTGTNSGGTSPISGAIGGAMLAGKTYDALSGLWK